MIYFGFYCVRRLLIALNLFYTFLSIVLISLAIHVKSISIMSIGFIGGIIFCGIFLFIISIVGLIGTLKHHQVMLFFYMVALSLCFAIQFIIACACLTVIANNSQFTDLVASGWLKLSNETRIETQKKYNCCGFLKEEAECAANASKTCADEVKDSVSNYLRTIGGVSLAFSFTNLFGVWLAIRYRNQRDPKCNPNSFL